MSKLTTSTYTQTFGDLAEAQAAACLCVAADLVPFLWGGFGLGKTSWAYSLAEALNVPVEVVLGSVREPQDFAGVPVVAGDGSMSLAPPNWAKRLIDGGVGLLFFDEASNAKPMVQNALMRVIFEREVGDYTLPARVRMICAANPATSGGARWDLDPPLANRVVHIDYPVDKRAISEGFRHGWKSPSVIALPGGQIPDDILQKWMEKIGIFLDARDELVYAVPDDPVLAGRGFPTPRSWEMTARIYAAGEATNAPSNVCDLAAAGAVGFGAMSEFTTWLEDAALPDAETILADPEGAVIPDRDDRIRAATLAVVGAVVRKPKEARYQAAWKYFNKIATNHAKDVVYSAAKELVTMSAGKSWRVPAEAVCLFDLLVETGDI